MRTVVCGLAFAAVACDNPPATATSPGAETLELRVQTEHFRLLAGATADASLRAAADRLEAEYPRIRRELNLRSLPVITVRIWQDRTTYFNELTRHWFWETVALYENGEFVDPRTIDYLVRGSFPTLQQLNVDPHGGSQIYQLGYVLGECIVSHWGRPAFLRLIESNADLAAVLGMSSAEFETAWQSYVRQRYLS